MERSSTGKWQKEITDGFRTGQKTPKQPKNKKEEEKQWIYDYKRERSFAIMQIQYSEKTNA